MTNKDCHRYLDYDNIEESRTAVLNLFSDIIHSTNNSEVQYENINEKIK